MTTTHHLDGEVTEPGTGADSGDWLDYADTEFRKIPPGKPIPMDVRFALDLGAALVIRENTAVMAEFIAEQRRARAVSEGLASASVDDEPDADQVALQFPSDVADEAEQAAEATG